MTTNREALMSELRKKVARLVPYHKEHSSWAVADRILAIPEIAEALAYPNQRVTTGLGFSSVRLGDLYPPDAQPNSEGA